MPAPILRSCAIWRVRRSVLRRAACGSQSDPLEEVIVVGVRRSLETSQEIKATPTPSSTRSPRRTSAHFRTSRWPRRCSAFRASPCHGLHPAMTARISLPSQPPLLIRGLTFVRTEFNGRDSFSADGYRGLNFNDISPELMAGVDVYKNQTAEMVEGGIAGTVNLRTRLPLDSGSPCSRSRAAPTTAIAAKTRRTRARASTADTSGRPRSGASASWRTMPTRT